MTGAGETIISALRRRPERGPAELTFHLDSGVVELSAATCLARSAGLSSVLQARGVRAGDHVGVLGPNHPEWILWAVAVWRLGAAIVPLPLHLVDRSAAVAGTARLLAAAGCRLVVADPEVSWAVPAAELLPWDVAPTTADRQAPDEADPRPGNPAVIQFTSGSTRSPRGIVLSHGAIVAACHNGAASNGLVAGRDRTLSWLPFFHDMGLFGYLVRPLVTGIPGHVLPTQKFLEDPAIWLRLVSATGATFTAGPGSAWGAALKALERDPTGVDLRHVRGCLFGAERIDPDLIERLRQDGARVGLDPDAVISAYGMAEATLGVTGRAAMSGLPFDHVQEAALRSGRAVPAPAGAPSTLRIASCGTAMAGTSVRIVGDGGPLPDRYVGEIEVSGPTLLSGYVDSDESPSPDGWLRTGDLGYLADGELYVTGRRKDVIIAMGRNYAPDDLEWAAARVPGVRPGRCVAFAAAHTDGHAVVVVEPSTNANPGALIPAVRKAVTLATGLRPAEILVVPPGTVLKTTSGKLRRSEMRDLYADGALPSLA